jgi:putative Mg2+ transporter-C (MgtC) family protein
MISFPAMLLRLVLALVLGALIGIERARSEHTAGMRTNALVSLGAALFTIISAFGFMDLLGIAHVQLDPTRIASYVVAGIGFMGAGSIFLSRETDRVKGLTTAATTWLVAAIGMACGAGLFFIAVVTTGLALIVLVFLWYLEKLLLPHQTSSLHTLSIETELLTDPLVEQVQKTFKTSSIPVKELHLQTGQGVATIKVICSAPNTAKLTHVVCELQTLPGVRTVEAKLSKPMVI